MEGKKWTYERNGAKEDVALEAWMWAVQYTDGTILKQFGDDGTFHQFQEIAQEKVAVFSMVKTDGSGEQHSAFVKEGMKIFHYYQRHKFRAAGKPDVLSTVYVFGWKNPNGSSTYMYLLPSGRILVGTEGELTFTGDILQKELGIE